jgi:hypothetical protein
METTKTQIHLMKLPAENYMMPTREDVQNLKVGDIAPYVFGMDIVTSIYALDVDISGRAFVCYYVRQGDNGTISASMKEGELVRTMRLCNAHTSAELDSIESAMRKWPKFVSVTK